MATTTTTNSRLLLIVVIALVVVGAFYFFNGKDERTTGQRVGNAVDSFTETHSLDRANQQLKNQTPAQKLNNEIKDKSDENRNH